MTTEDPLTPGTTLRDEYGATLTIDVIHEDGHLDVTVVDANGPARGSETWTAGEIRRALREGSLRTNDGEK
jgi:hypothetical protein